MLLPLLIIHLLLLAAIGSTLTHFTYSRNRSVQQDIKVFSRHLRIQRNLCHR